MKSEFLMTNELRLRKFQDRGANPLVLGIRHWPFVSHSSLDISHFHTR